MTVKWLKWSYLPINSLPKVSPLWTTDYLILQRWSIYWFPCIEKSFIFKTGCFQQLQLPVDSRFFDMDWVCIFVMNTICLWVWTQLPAKLCKQQQREMIKHNKKSPYWSTHHIQTVCIQHYWTPDGCWPHTGMCHCLSCLA